MFVPGSTKCPYMFPSSVKRVRVQIRLQKKGSDNYLGLQFCCAVLIFETKIDDFLERVTYQKAIEMFKTIHREAPDYLKKSFNFS